MKKTNYLKEFLSLIILASITAFFILLLGFPVNYIESITSIHNYGYWIAGYFILLILFYFATTKYNNKLFQYSFLFLSLPFSIFYILFTFGIPFITLFFHALFYACFSISLPILFYTFNNICNFNVSNQLAIYITLTSSVLISIIFHKQLVYIVHAISPARLKTSEKLRPYQIEELSNYLLSESNIKFIIFILYFLLLVLINAFNLQEIEYFSNKEVDKAVLQSFATFVAFDRVISYMKQLKFKPSEMLIKIFNAIDNKIKSK